jgi:hypothetical protein
MFNQDSTNHAMNMTMITLKEIFRTFIFETPFKLLYLLHSFVRITDDTGNPFKDFFGLVRILHNMIRADRDSVL